MSQSNPRIVFLGTPDFASGCLEALLEAHMDVVAVVTMPDKPAGRGHKLQPSSVKQCALEHGLDVLQPERLKDEAFLEELRSYEADLFIVVAFRMLPEVVWGMPRMGTFNLHASLLPQYRGAAPINWAVMNGETQTGVTTFFLDREIDTGKIIFQESCPIYPDDDAGTLHDRLLEMGSQLVVRTVSAIAQGTAPSLSQSSFVDPSEPLKPAPKIFKETCMVSFQRSARDIVNQIRGLSPYPAAMMDLETEDKEVIRIKVFKASALDENPAGMLPGEILTDGRTYLKVKALDGMVSLESLQLPGKKRLALEDLLRGFTISNSFRFINPSIEINS